MAGADPSLPLAGVGFRAFQLAHDLIDPRAAPAAWAVIASVIVARPAGFEPTTPWFAGANAGNQSFVNHALQRSPFPFGATKSPEQ